LACVLVVAASLMAFGSEQPAAVRTVLAPSKRLLPTSPPRPQIVAFQGALRIQLPVNQSHVTAIGYHAAGDGAFQLDPVGRQGNQGLFTRVVHKLFGGSRRGLVYYRLEGGSGTPFGALDVGAAPGTDVYSPVDGTVVGLTDFVLDGKRYGVRVDIQPSSAPSVLVSLTHLRPDQSLSVGSSVAAATSKIGTVIDLSGVERQVLARYTQDAGNHVSLEVHPAAALAVP
jgi:murein DD-endopeptidase MepM/ murein hydrolase activator NlpD